jgi:hypothetical protein
VRESRELSEALQRAQAELDAALVAGAGPDVVAAARSRLEWLKSSRKVRHLAKGLATAGKDLEAPAAGAGASPAAGLGKPVNAPRWWVAPGIVAGVGVAAIVGATVYIAQPASKSATTSAVQTNADFPLRPLPLLPAATPTPTPTPTLAPTPEATAAATPEATAPPAQQQATPPPVQQTPPPPPPPPANCIPGVVDVNGQSVSGSGSSLDKNYSTTVTSGSTVSVSISGLQSCGGNHYAMRAWDSQSNGANFGYMCGPPPSLHTSFSTNPPPSPDTVYVHVYSVGPNGC